MNPKDKANELVLKYLRIDNNTKEWFNTYIAKQCALIAVDEVLEQWEYIDTYLSDLGGELNPNLKYWQEVRKEVESL